MRSGVRRGRILSLGIFLGWVGLLIRLGEVQIGKWRYYQERAKGQHWMRVEIPGERGKIYDRNGRLVAFNRSSCAIRIHPRYVRDMDTLAEILSDFGLGGMRENRRAISAHKGFFTFWKGLEATLGDSLRKVLTKRQFSNAVVVQDVFERVYPYGELCADIVGFAVSDGGRAGLEWELDGVLRGKPGWVLLQKDALGWTFPYPSYPMKKAMPGFDVQLTIDVDIQEICYRALEDGVVRSGAQRGSVVVLDAQTGAILAAVDYPGYNPERYAEFPPERYKLAAVADQFEPGSSFKIVICAASLEDSALHRFTERLYDVSRGFIEIGSHKIKDVHPNGVLSFDSIFIQSSNLGCALLSFDVNPELYYSVARGLGFGQKVDIGLPDEGSGRLDKPKALKNRLRFATISFGQGVMVTLLQLACAYLCVANDGVYLKPYLIQSLKGNGRTIVLGKKIEVRRALHPETAVRIKDILERVVRNGTGKLAAIPNTRVCGKTGTAQKVEPWGGYSSTRSLMTFVGFFPKEDPRYTIAVMLDEPTQVRFAGSAACPVFKEIGERLLRLEQLRSTFFAGGFYARR